MRCAAAPDPCRPHPDRAGRRELLQNAIDAVRDVPRGQKARSSSVPGRERNGGGGGTRRRARALGRRRGAHVRAVLHHQAGRPGTGPGHQPLHHRGPQGGSGWSVRLAAKRGTTVRFTLPLHAEAKTRRGAPHEREPTVYVVDDNLGVRKSLRALVESAGFAVEAYASSEEFLARLRSEASGLPGAGRALAAQQRPGPAGRAAPAQGDAPHHRPDRPRERADLRTRTEGGCRRFPAEAGSAQSVAGADPRGDRERSAGARSGHRRAPP